MKKETLTERINELEFSSYVVQIHTLARIDALENAIVKLCGGQETTKTKEVFFDMYRSIEMTYHECLNDAPEHLKQRLDIHFIPILHDTFTRIQNLQSELSEQ